MFKNADLATYRPKVVREITERRNAARLG